MRLPYSIIFCLMNISVNGQNNADGRDRQRRYLLFTPNTQWGVFATVSVPLKAGSLVNVAWFFEANYYNVANASYLEPLLGDIEFPSSRSQRSAEVPSGILTRTRLYAFIETMLEQIYVGGGCNRAIFARRHGYPGRACLLRAICEGTTSHLWHNGVLGDVLYLILTPSTSASEADVRDCYYEAEYNGLEDNCEHYSYNCPSSPLEFISMYIDNRL